MSCECKSNPGGCLVFVVLGYLLWLAIGAIVEHNDKIKKLENTVSSMQKAEASK